MWNWGRKRTIKIGKMSFKYNIKNESIKQAQRKNQSEEFGFIQGKGGRHFTEEMVKYEAKSEQVLQM